MSVAVRRGLYGKLAGDVTLNALLGAPANGYAKAIYHDEAPQGASYPFVLFSKSSGVPVQSQTQPAALEQDVWMVKGVDRNATADPVDAINARIGTLLNDAALSISGATLSYLRRESDVEYSEVVDGVSYRHAGALYRMIYE